MRLAVAATPVDGMAHGFRGPLQLSGSVYRLAPFVEDTAWGFLSGSGIYSSVPQLKPGTTKQLTARYPDPGSKDVIRPGHRLYLTAEIAQVVNNASRKSGSPKVVTVVLTVPHSGDPRVRIVDPRKSPHWTD